MMRLQNTARFHDSAARLALKIAATIACRIVLNTARRFIYPFAPDLSRVLGVPLTAITGLIAVNWATNLLGLVFGPAADRFGYRGMMILGMAMLSVGMLAGGVWPLFGVLVAAQFLSGLGKSIYDPAVQAYVSGRVPFHRRGLAVGFLETAWAGSTLVGIPLMAVLIDLAGWQSAFFALSASGFLGLVLMTALIPGEGKPPFPGRQRVTLRQLFGGIAGSRPAMSVVTYTFLFNIAMDNLFVVYGAWLEDSFNLSLLALGAGTTVIGAAELSGEFITAGLADRIGLKRVVIGGVTLCMLTYAALPFVATTVALALAALFVHFCIFETTIVTTISLTTELLPQSRATMIAAYYAAAGLGRVVGALLGGPVWLAAGIAATGLISSALSALALTVLLWGLRGLKKY
jgi:predicted MFS family arabinose efflux permease